MGTRVQGLGIRARGAFWKSFARFGEHASDAKGRQITFRVQNLGISHTPFFRALLSTLTSVFSTTSPDPID